MARLISDEARVALGEVASVGLLDIKGFYDHIQWHKLLEESVFWHYPAHVMCLSLQMYMAPRMIRQRGWMARDPVVPGRSVATGERNGNHAARIYTYRLIQAMHDSYRCMEIKQWVDDVPLRVYGAKQHVFEVMVSAFTDVKKLMNKMGLILADKTTILCSERRLAGVIQRALAKEGVKVKTASEALDLGLDVGMGARPAKAKHLKRKAMSAKRIKNALALRGQDSP